MNFSYAWNCAKCFQYIMLFNSHRTPRSSKILSSPFLKRILRFREIQQPIQGHIAKFKSKPGIKPGLDQDSLILEYPLVSLTEPLTLRCAPCHGMITADSDHHRLVVAVYRRLPGAITVKRQVVVSHTHLLIYFQLFCHFWLEYRWEFLRCKLPCVYYFWSFSCLL